MFIYFLNINILSIKYTPISGEIILCYGSPRIPVHCPKSPANSVQPLFKSQWYLFEETENHLKFIRNLKEPWLATMILRKKNEVGGPKAAGARTVWCRPAGRHLDRGRKQRTQKEVLGGATKWSSTGVPRLHTHQGKQVSSTPGAGKTGYTHAETNGPSSYSTYKNQLKMD